MESIKVQHMRRDGTQELVEIYNQAEMEDSIIENNKKHFAQVEGTMPTVPPMSEIIGNGHNKAYNAIYYVERTK